MNDKIKKRYERKVIKNGQDKCWDWSASKMNFGYGRMGVGGNKWNTAHRISWEIHVGKIPKGMFVLHKCDNPPCSNPKHLFLGTQRENIQDARNKGRMSSVGGEKCATTVYSDEYVIDAIKRLKKSGLTVPKFVAKEKKISVRQMYDILCGKSRAYIVKNLQT